MIPTHLIAESITMAPLAESSIRKESGIDPELLDPNSRHYDAGGIETLTVIQAKLTREQYEGYLLGNVIKYASRANHKASYCRDIDKLFHYAQLLKASVNVPTAEATMPGATL